MRILLVGPYPPPHGGISVHIANVRQRLRAVGVDCCVVNVDPAAPLSSDYISVRGGVDLFLTLLKHAMRGWTLHVHTNGHNLKSWLVALTAGIAGVVGRGSVLTLHSGLAPHYLAPAHRVRRTLARVTCLFYSRVIAVSPAVKSAVASLGVSAEKIELLPAFLLGQVRREAGVPLPDLKKYGPVLGTALFFRPEYGFHTLVGAVEELRRVHPRIACLVMGSGEEQAQAEQLVAERGLQQSIFLLGNVAHEACLSIMSQCDVFVRPALADGDANCVREALALGVPVVASAAGNRPAGTIIFRTGSADDLVAKVGEAIRAPVAPPTTQETSIGELIAIYGSL